MAAQFRDYYQTLGVEKTAGADELKKAFRTLARKFHPDTAKDKKMAEEKFKEINEAYEVLGDPEKRKKYDEFGANWQQGGPPPGWQQPGRGPRGARPGGGGVEFEFGGTGFSD
ncbi:MAG: DnaJ domain-containing protein, partial [Terrimicrobiaceae bacterium]